MNSKPRGAISRGQRLHFKSCNPKQQRLPSLLSSRDYSSSPVTQDSRDYPRYNPAETTVQVQLPKTAETTLVITYNPAETTVQVLQPETAETTLVITYNPAETTVQVQSIETAETPVQVIQPETAETTLVTIQQRLHFKSCNPRQQRLPSL